MNTCKWDWRTEHRFSHGNHSEHNAETTKT